MLKITAVLADNRTMLVGTDRLPQFGWRLEADRRNVRQTSYQLQIAQEQDFSALVYDSGVVESGDSAHVRAAFPLESLRRYFVRVRVTAGQEQTEWSAPAVFITSLLEPEKEWRAAFVSAEQAETCAESSKGTYLRGTFTVKKELCAAYACTTALGLYNFYLNGSKVGADEMTPGWTSYQKNLCYQTYDVTSALQPGLNAAGAMLGAGWFKGVMGLTRSRNNYGDRTAFAMQLLLRYADGTQETVTTNADWLGADSPITFSEIYHGETYDQALEIENWAQPHCAGGQWRGVETLPWSTATLRAQAGGCVQVAERLPATSVFTTPGGDTVVDFGQNMAGRIEITAFGTPGDVIELRCFETLDAAGNVYLDNLRKARTTMQYTFDRAGTVTWHPRFTYMGFRYALVVRWPGTPKKESFTACAMYSAMPPVGSFTCSNPLLNQLHHNILWGLKSNFLDVPTDCPQRDERLGWTGDAQIFCRTACYLMDTDQFYGKWLIDLAADQMPDGGVPHVVPNIEECHTDKNWLLTNSPYGASAWGDAAVIVPWTLYLMYGDTAVLERQYKSMKAWIDFMTANSKDGIFGFRMQLGDWVALDAEPGSYFGATPTELTCAAYYAYSTGLFARAAAVLGRKEDAAAYAQLHQTLVRRFGEVFFDANGCLTAQTQTAHIVALYFDLVPPAYKPQTLAGLKRLLAEQNGHLVTGFIGTPYFCHALSQNGCLQEAYELLLQEDYPSWLYQVKRGATTVWEHWDGLKPDGTMWSAGMNSFNHYAYGAVGEWMYRVMAGIEPSPDGAGFCKAIIYPRPGGGLTEVQASYCSVYGAYTVRWQARGEEIALNVTLPPNTAATIRLASAQAVLQADGLTFIPCGDDLQAEAGSGSYQIVYRTKTE